MVNHSGGMLIGLLNFKWDWGSSQVNHVQASFYAAKDEEKFHLPAWQRPKAQIQVKKKEWLQKKMILMKFFSNTIENNPHENLWSDLEEGCAQGISINLEHFCKEKWHKIGKSRGARVVDS